MENPVIITYGSMVVTLSGVTWALTHVFKELKTIPVLSRIRAVQWLLDRVTDGNTTDIRIFSALVAYGLSQVGLYLTTGEIPVFDAETAVTTIVGFLGANGLYTLAKK